MGVARRGLGALLILLALLPGYRILGRSEVGPFGEWVLSLEAQATDLILWGSLIAVGGGIVFAILADPAPLRRSARRLGSRLAALRRVPFAILCGLLSGAIAAVAAQVLFDGLPVNVDSMASLVHGRYLAHGMPGGPVPEVPASQLILNTVLTEEGWVSLYPPLHPALLGIGFRLGAAHLVGPLMTAVAVAATASLVLESLPERPRTARAAAIVTALSPFIAFVGGSYLSHTSAAAGIALTAWSAHRARRGSWGWALAAGASAGMAVSARPWTGLVVCGGLLLYFWLPLLREPRRGAARLSGRFLAAASGGLPFAAALLAYNAQVFGHPLRLGYMAAYGPSHGLGFHPDPWGYPYGLTEALGYTAADLTSLSLHLLETPLPVVGLVGLYLLSARRLPGATKLFLLWALLPVAANFFYWHHGFQMGPRMLYEAAPAWCVLATFAATDTAMAIDEHDAEGDHFTFQRLSGAGIGTIGLALLGPLLLVPVRIQANAWDEETLARMTAPSPPEEPALVFVHGSWSERVSARLRATGIRLDSLEVAVRRNDLCVLDQFARDRTRGEPISGVDFRPLPGVPEDLQAFEVQGGTRVRRDPEISITETCRREMRADRLGAISLAPLLWQGDLPGLERGQPLFLRDMAPQSNRQIQQRYPDRAAYLLFPSAPDAAPALLPYNDGIRILWSDTEQDASDSSSKIPDREEP